MADEESDVMREIEAQWNPQLANAGTNVASEGNAVLKVTNSFLNRAKTSGRKQMTWSCEVMTHEQDSSSVGSKVPVRFGIEDVKDYKRLNTTLMNVNMDVVREPKDINRVKHDVIGMVFAASIVKNPDPQFPPNVYINAGARRKDLEGGAENTPPAEEKRF